jgi:hypothetical protein
MHALLGLVFSLALAPAAAAADAWSLPEPGSCNPKGGRLSAGGEEDATRFPFDEGARIGPDRVDALRSYLPPFVWEERERFFHEGARLEVGPCFRDYAAPAFFREAGSRPARLGPDGELLDYGAGLPFAPEGISADDPRAGLAWLWNVEQRYQGAGFHGRFRLSDVTGGDAKPYVGRIFKIAVSHRADRPGPGFEIEDAGGRQWVAGGEFEEPFDAKDYAWRQIRGGESLGGGDRPDELFAYLPQWRRVRRLPSTHVESLFVPTPAIAAAQSNQLAVGAGVPSGGAGLGDSGGGAGSGTGAGAAGGIGVPADVGQKAEPLRGGFEPFGLRPNLYDVRVVGRHDVLAPINVARPMWPEADDRDFGPSGLSFANDRWELRRALVLEARRRGEQPAGRTLLYVDLQTLQPLYLATYDAQGELLDVAVYASRWSEDRPDYPRWPGDAAREIRVLDPVGAAVTSADGRGGWRRESWNMVSTPPPDDELRRWTSVGELTRGR